MMNPEIKQRWIEALRSGEYRQGKGQLVEPGGEKGDKFCCLGVLCDIYSRTKEGRKNKAGWVWDDEAESFFFSDGKDYVEGILPSRVRDWAGLSYADPEITDPDYGTRDLSNMNDGDGGEIKPYRFKKIARLIEKEL